LWQVEVAALVLAQLAVAVAVLAAIELHQVLLFLRVLQLQLR
jgi:hypothetical protein